MSLVTLVVVVALVGLLIWGVTTLVPMPPKFQQIIYVLGVVIIVIYVLNAFQLLGGIHDIKIGK